MWKKIQSWFREVFFTKKTPQRPLLKENEEYCFTEIILEEEKVNAVKLLTGPFAGVAYYYGHVKVVPENGTHRLAYQYTIWDSASFTKAELTGSAAFTNSIGDVLVALIADENQSGEYNGPTRIDDTQESDLS